MMDPPPAPAASDLFQGPRGEKTFGGDLGLCRGPSFTPAEVRRIAELIKTHMIGVAREVSPDAVAELDASDLERFHQVRGYDHPRMLSKRGRILDEAAMREIKAMSFFDYVREGFGAFCLADEDDIGHEQITFRLVRPEQADDVGSLHCDAWFWDALETPLPAGLNRTKVWAGVCVQPALNGLRLAPGSHRRAAPYHVDRSGAKLTFVPDFDIDQIGLRQYGGQPGEPILFNYRTLHVGSFNRADVCRVSIETTILYR